MNYIRNLRGNALKKYKEELKLTPDQRSIIVGTLLGDATMRLSGGRPVYSIKFEQGIQHKQYVEHLFEVFEAFCGTRPKDRFVDKQKTRKSVSFTTYRHHEFIFYYNYFYDIQDQQDGSKKGVKVIRKNIHKYLTPMAVAYWFMDDGTFIRDSKSGSKSYYFSTQGFEKTESQRLCDALKHNFNISANVHKDKDKWRIYVVASSKQTLLDLITPYIHSDFIYKLEL